MIKPFRGHYVGGDFQIGNGASFLSTNQARDYEVVFEARDGLEIVDAAVDAARQAATSWRRLSFEERAEVMSKVAERVSVWAEPIANAISMEMGKSVSDTCGGTLH